MKVYQDPFDRTRMVLVKANHRMSGHIERCIPAPAEKVMLWSGSYAPDHPYLKMTIEQLLDEEFCATHKSTVPGCWFLAK